MVQLNELALFAGAGGGILGGHLLEWRTLCAVEWDPYAASVLVARQNDGCLPTFPVWDDVQTFDGRPWRGRIDVVSGGFPCQDISAAGKGAGIDGERSGMWTHMARIIGEVRPRFALVENSPMLTLRGLGRVLGDLAAMGYHARWGVVSAADAGAPHLRARIWILAHTQHHAGCAEQFDQPRQELGRESTEEENAMLGRGRQNLADAGSGWGQNDELRAGRDESRFCGQNVADAVCVGGCGGNDPRQDAADAHPCRQGIGSGSNRQWWATEPDVGGVAHELADRLDGHNQGLQT